MVHAFVMVKTAAGQAKAVLEAVVGLGGVEEGHLLAGDYDLIAEIDAPEIHDLTGTISTDIRELDGIVDTRTYIALE